MIDGQPDNCSGLGRSLEENLVRSLTLSLTPENE